MAVLADFVLETCSAPGTATFSLGGPPDGRVAFSSVFATASTPFYFCVSTDGTQFEGGLGTLTTGSPDLLARTTVLSNSLGTTAHIDFGGSTYVYNEVPAAYSLYINATGGFSPPTLTAIDMHASGAVTLAGTSTTITATSSNLVLGSTLGSTIISSLHDLSISSGTGRVVLGITAIQNVTYFRDSADTVTYAAFLNDNFVHATPTSDPLGASTDGTALRSVTTAGANGLAAIYRTNGTALDIGLGTAATKALNFFCTGAPVGNITLLSGGIGTSYNTTSDYRLKENVTPLTGALDRIAALSVKRFNWIGHHQIVDGMLAHEVALVVPEAVTGEKDAVDDEGKPIPQMVDWSKCVPLSLAATQELYAIVRAQGLLIEQLLARNPDARD
jgi:hypothetical protein